MTDMGHLHYYLGIEVTQHPKYIFLSQKKYVGELFEDGHLRSGNLSKEELRSKIGYLDVSIPTLGSSSGEIRSVRKCVRRPSG